MVVDVGTGDGRYVVRTAAAQPGGLVVGIDPNAAGLGAGFSEAQRRRLGNALFVVASAEALPTELAGVADEVRVHFPWAALLDAVVSADPAVCAGLAGLLRPDERSTHQRRLVIALSVVGRDRHATIDELDGVGARDLARRLARATGLGVVGVRAIDRSDLDELQSSWARRLGVGRRGGRPAWRIELRG